MRSNFFWKSKKTPKRMLAMMMTGTSVDTKAESEEPWPRASPELPPPPLLLALALCENLSVPFRSCTRMI